MTDNEWARKTVQTLQSMPPDDLIEGVRLAAQMLIQGEPMRRELELLSGLCIMEICNRYKLSVVRESN
jgi:hypothetical protein